MAAVVQHTPLNLLTTEMNTAAVKVKVFVTWKKTYFSNPNSAMSLEMILIDDQGNKIRATVPKRWISFYEPTFVEGKYYELVNFGVVECDDKVKLIPNSLKISIFRSTTITVCPAFDIPIEGYSTVNFQDLLEWKFNSDAVFDVVGALVEMKPMRVKRENGVDTKSLEFTLKDNSGNTIRCALWSHHATRVFDYVSARKNDEDSIVLLMHNCKIREWQGVPQVSNQLWGCRVYINEDIPTINQFKAQILTGDGDSLKSTIGDILTQTLVETAIESFTKHAAKTCHDVGFIHEVTTCVVRGRVSKLCDEEAWYTYACKACHKKVESFWSVETNSSNYNCVNCGDVKEVYPRIRVSMEVEDTTGSVTLVVFDSQMSKMMKKSVNWLKMLAECSVDKNVIPNELKEVLYKPFVWMIRVTDFNLKYNYPGYTVDNVTDDMEVFEAIDMKLKNSNPGQSSASATPDGSVVTVHNVSEDEVFKTPADVTVKPYALLSLIHFTKRKPTTCKELNEMEEENKCVLRGKITAVAPENGWITFTCRRCKKMAGPKCNILASGLDEIDLFAL